VNLGNGYGFVGGRPYTRLDYSGLRTKHSVTITSFACKSVIIYYVDQKKCSQGGGVLITVKGFESTPDDNSIDATDLIEELGISIAGVTLFRAADVKWGYSVADLPDTTSNRFCKKGYIRKVARKRISVHGVVSWLKSSIWGEGLITEEIDGGQATIKGYGLCCCKKKPKENNTSEGEKKQ
jgi:hypothetical protein